MYTAALRMRRLRERTLAGLVLSAGMVCCIVSCKSDNEHSVIRPSHSAEKIDLDPEAARDAIIRFLEGLPDDSPSKKTLAMVKASSPRTLSPGRVAIGPWDCRLDEKRLTLLLDKPQAFFLLEGEFIQGSTGVWNVLVTRTARN